MGQRRLFWSIEYNINNGVCLTDLLSGNFPAEGQEETVRLCGKPEGERGDMQRQLRTPSFPSMARQGDRTRIAGRTNGVD